MKKIIAILFLIIIANNVIAQAVTKHGESTSASSDFVNENGKIGSRLLTKNGEIITLPMITTTSMMYITQTTATSGGSITSDGGSEVTARGVCWSINPSPTIADSSTINGSGIGSFTSNITGLIPNTTYYVRAYATNNNGTAYGSQISFSSADYLNCGIINDIRDGNTYQTVQIGYQCWMRENLKYLPSVVGSDIISFTTPYYYVYGFEGTNVSTAKATSNYATYGVLYNWTAAMNGSLSSSSNPSGVIGICPNGWHLPSEAEWDQLVGYLEGSNGAAYKLKETGTAHWNSPNFGSTNETGFSCLPGGYIIDSYHFCNIGIYGFFWSSEDFSISDAWARVMYYNDGGVYELADQKNRGLSIRCVRD